MNKIFANEHPDPSIYLIHGKILSINKIFEKENCFKLYNIDILSKENIISNNYIFNIDNKKCRDDFFLSNYWSKFLEIPNFNYINNKYKLWEDYYFKLSMIPLEKTDFKGATFFISPIITDITKENNYENLEIFDNWWYKLNIDNNNYCNK